MAIWKAAFRVAAENSLKKLDKEKDLSKDISLFPKSLYEPLSVAQSVTGRAWGFDEQECIYSTEQICYLSYWASFLYELTNKFHFL